MLLLSVLIWTLLPHPALLLLHRHCAINKTQSTDNPSPLLQSLQCHNDYESYVRCQWTEESHRQLPLQLWFLIKNQSVLCPPHEAPVRHPDGQRTVWCRYKTTSFSIGITHTVFFTDKKNCSSLPHQPMALSQHLRALPPVDLVTYDADFGDQWLHWSSPYPDSSFLSKNMTYQVSYRSHGDDEWTIKNVTQSSVKLLKKSLRAGHTYRARVRGRTGTSHWSVWSPVVTWRTKEESGQRPRLHCVLAGEETVECRWDVSRDQDHFISYQLTCRHNQTSTSVRCCWNPTVVSDPSGTKLTYSCSLRATEPAHLHLELLPTHKAKTFNASKHIRPNPPRQLSVNAKGANWLVNWTEPKTSPDIRLFYQVCYYQTETLDCSVLLNVSDRFLNVLDSSLIPSQSYTVHVRSVVEPGKGSRYEGTPSEWAGPEEWTSHAAAWSIETTVYFSVAVLVALVFLALYCTAPACHRRAVLWVGSVPSPEKSKIISEFKSASEQHVMLHEKTSICKVQHLEKPLPRGSPVQPHKDEGVEFDYEYWSSENSSPAQQIMDSHLSVMGFSGPYIFCKQNFPSEATEQTEASEGGAYVCLPSHPASTSTLDLVFQHQANTYCCNCNDSDLKWPDSPEAHDGAGTTTTVLNEPTSSDPYVSGPFTSWPTIQASGYCSLPANEVK